MLSILIPTCFAGPLENINSSVCTEERSGFNSKLNIFLCVFDRPKSCVLGNLKVLEH